MLADLINPFVTSAVATLEDMTRGPVRRTGLTSLALRHAPGEYNAATLVTGRATGLVVLSLSAGTAASIAGLILGPDRAPIPPLLRSVVAELADLIARQAVEDLTDRGIPISITSPRHVERGEALLSTPALFLSVTLDTTAGSLELLVALQAAELTSSHVGGHDPETARSGRGQHAAILDIIARRAVSMVLQPVISVPRAQVVGYEALLRGPVGTPLYRPDPLFEAANAAGVLDRLERLARRSALETKGIVPHGLKLFINIDARVPILDVACPLYEYLRDQDADPHELVLEVTERTVLNRSPDLLISLEEFKAAGGNVALDDVGAGESGLQAVLAVQPQFMKLDRSLVRKVHQNKWQAAMINAFVHFARDVGATVVAEGVETVDELLFLRELGVDMVQGFLLARPVAEPVLIIDGLAAEALRSD